MRSPTRISPGAVPAGEPGKLPGKMNGKKLERTPQVIETLIDRRRDG